MSSPARNSSSNLPLYAGIFFISAASLAIEITLTRILSVITWYYLAYFAVSLAMLGMTAGAVRVYLTDGDFDSQSLDRSLTINALIFAWITPVALVLVCLIPLTSPSVDFFSLLMPSLALLFASAACALPFYFSGVAITALLTRSTAPVARLYAADLIGAAAACVFVIAGLNRMDAPSLVILCGAVGAIAAFFFSLRAASRGLRVFSLVSFCALLALAAINARTRSGIRPLMIKNVIDNPAAYALERWNSFSKIGVSHEVTAPPQYWGKSPAAPETPVPQRGLNIDGNAGTNLRRFASEADIEHLRYDITSLGYYIAPAGPAGIIGVGGARDLQTAILFRHTPVVGVDVNPIFISLLRKEFADFAGVARRPDVRLVVAEGRSYFTATSERFSIIQMSLVDTWAATGAGAFTLSENALYTTEAWNMFIQRLGPGGIFTVSRWFNAGDVNEAERMVSLAIAALLEQRIPEPSKHVALIAVNNVATLLVCRDPFSQEQISELKRTSEKLEYLPLLIPGEELSAPVLTRLAAARSLRELEAVAALSPLNVSPPTDEKPYFFNMLRLRNTGYALRHGHGVAVGNLVATVFLAGLISVLLVLLVAVVVTPLIVKYRLSLRQLAGSRGFVAGGFYFSLIGAGFMFAEIGVMQRMSIFLGHPVYALVVLLLTITFSSGCGSFLSEYLPRRRRVLLIYPVAIAICILLVRHLLSYLHQVAITYSLGTKIALTIASIFPLGLLLGTCFPLGMYLVSGRSRDHAPWYWGLNGILGVLASTLSVFISIYFGISTTFFLAAGCYFALVACNVALLRDVDTAS